MLDKKHNLKSGNKSKEKKKRFQREKKTGHQKKRKD